MEIEQNEEKYPLEHIPEENNTTKNLNDWMNLTADIPAGLFYHDALAGVMHINSKLLGYLKQEQMPISPVLEEYFWSRLESLAEDPGQAHVLIQEARAQLHPNQYAEFKLGLGNDSCLVIRLFQINLDGSDDQNYGGIVLDLIDDQSNYLRQVKMLEAMSVQARKTNASAKGNLDALVDNLHIWSPDVVDEFLFDARDQLDLVNQSLDLILNLIQAYESIPVFSDSVNVVELIKEIISEEKQEEYRLLEGQDHKSNPPLSFLDPALTRLALEYLMKEIASSNAEGQQVDVSIEIKKDNLFIKVESPRTLPLPGLSPDQEEISPKDLNIRIYLAKKIINAQGGSITFLRKEPGSEAVSSIEISLPSEARLQVIQKPDLSLGQEEAIEGRILLAEAQAEYQIQLRDTLQGAGYRVDLASDGSSALDMAQSINPDLIIVARNLPGLDGLLVTQGIRRWSAIPVIMLSERTDPGDLLYAYQLGVDDYLRKPVPTLELLARARVCLRRSANARHPLTPDIFQSNLMRIDYSTRQVWIRGKPVDLTPIEYNLLVFMSRQGKQIMPYEQLLDSVWEGPEKGTRQGLFVHVKRLREKVEVDPKNPQIISNKWGVGYVFNP
jgi:DNA-binding response OmpR family regulator